jgi:hypothetical protein
MNQQPPKNRISVLTNKFKKADIHPDYNVRIEMADGTKWEGGLWPEVAKSGEKYLSGVLNPPWNGGEQQRRPSRPPQKPQGGFNDMDDDIPYEPSKGKAVDW